MLTSVPPYGHKSSSYSDYFDNIVIAFALPFSFPRKKDYKSGLNIISINLIICPSVTFKLTRGKVDDGY